MCGIAGLAGPHDPGDIRRMCDLLAHRGPDDHGYYHDPGTMLSLGHRRLSILDPEMGRQPMFSVDGRLAIVFNGEIFNSPELRRDLENQGRRFITRNSDTETLLHLYQVMGTDMLERLNGMFAFAVYDQDRRALFMARDRSGIKPLYYVHQGRRLALASELKALTFLPFVSKEISPEGLYHYLSLQFLPSPCSILSSVLKLPAAHAMWFELDSGQTRVWRYWRPTFPQQPVPDTAELADSLNQTIKAAFKRWTLSDVPIACSLSGGLDSTSIVGQLSLAGLGPLSTYSLGFTDAGQRDIDELDLARITAERYGTRHHEVRLEAETLIGDLEAMVYSLDEPYAGGLPSWYIFKMIARDFKVALTGTGGDELFGNYGKWLRHEADPQTGLDMALGQNLAAREALAAAAAINPHGALYHRYLADSVKDALVPLARDIPAASKTESLIERLWAGAGSASARDAVPCVDFALQLPDEFLHMTDRFSMAFGLEARTPFLDNELVEAVQAVPAAVRTRPGELKYLLKAACAEVIPPELLAAPKRGFVLPLAHWTRTSLRERVEAVLSPSYLATQGIFSPRTWDTLVVPHLSGERTWTEQVWTLFMFQLWYERFVAGHHGQNNQ